MRSVLGYLVGWVMVLGLLALPAGLVMAGLGWLEARRISDVLARGVVAEARIDGGTRAAYGRRGRASYSLDLEWRDNDRVMRAERVPIGARLAGQIFVDGRITPASIAIKYIRADSADPVVLEDADELRRSQEEMAQNGIGFAVFGAVVTGCFLWRLRGERNAAQASRR